MFKILFADDENKLCEIIRDYFGAKGLNVDLAHEGAEAVELARKNDYDMIILDVMMPRKNGLEVCEEIRRFSNVPVMFLSALGEEYDLLAGYGCGADDYIVKPFPLSVLYEKCTAAIKRYKGLNHENNLTLCGITMDKNRFKIYVDSEEVSLSNKDFQLLEYLMLNKNIVLSRSLILTRVWGYDFEGDDRVVDTHIKTIRKALGEKAECIKTVINAGYCFEVK